MFMHPSIAHRAAQLLY